MKRFSVLALALALPLTAQVAQAASASNPQDAVIGYYNALGRGDYHAAYGMWFGNGQSSGKTYAQFKRGFTNTASTYVNVTGPTHTEVAAGSIYATVPVKISARLRNGQRQTFTGSYVVRKPNAGMSATDNDWHIYSATLR